MSTVEPASPSQEKELSKVSPENRWVEIQRKTFTNWINEQLSVSGRVIQDIEKDFCDGVEIIFKYLLLKSQKARKVETFVEASSGSVDSKL
uniref:Filamin-C n=1 Tax=Magallana gigas TaxID=29159 RepID=K1Q2D6_MAGGI